jgi:hypothetical protein
VITTSLTGREAKLGFPTCARCNVRENRPDTRAAGASSKKSWQFAIRFCRNRSEALSELARSLRYPKAMRTPNGDNTDHYLIDNRCGREGSPNSSDERGKLLNQISSGRVR